MNIYDTNQLWAELMIEELTRQGLDHFVISPGSRSTPLTAAVATRKESGKLIGEVVIHYDERGAAFHALGYGRATGKPAVLICTSGTAAANYYSAIIEASQDDVPLIALTADRPEELRNTGANQTIDQVDLYGKYPRWSHDLPAPDEQADPQKALTAIDLAISKALGPPAGPVQINCPFREPLTPIADHSNVRGQTSSLGNWYKSDHPLKAHTSIEIVPGDSELTEVADIIRGVAGGFLLVGRLDNDEQRAAVRALGEKIGWPILADVTSGLRFDSSDRIIRYFDLLLDSAVFAEGMRPRAVLHIGGRYVSKRLLQFLERSKPENYILVNHSPAPLDPAHCVTAKLQCDIPAFCRELIEMTTGSSSNEYLARWQAVDKTACKLVENECENAENITEAAIARYISQHLPDQSGLFLASSMPVRDMDMFAGVNDNDIAVASNRGASGIDGTIATASGFANGLDRPVTLLIGDLAFLHDLNSLALLSQSRQPITAIVLNNNGGGIFGHLPIARRTDIFEKYFVTPHGLNFEHAASMFDLPYTCVDEMPAFTTAFELAQQSDRSSIIEVTLDRKRDVELVNAVRAQIIAALDNQK